MRRAMLEPARRHYRRLRLSEAMHAWDERVLHGKKLKERRMGLAAMAHWRHRSLLARFARWEALCAGRALLSSILDRIYGDRLKAAMTKWVVRWMQLDGINARRKKALLVGQRALTVAVDAVQD